MRVLVWDWNMRIKWRLNSIRFVYLFYSFPFKYIVGCMFLGWLFTYMIRNKKKKKQFLKKRGKPKDTTLQLVLITKIIIPRNKFWNNVLRKVTTLFRLQLSSQTTTLFWKFNYSFPSKYSYGSIEGLNPICKPAIINASQL